MILVDYNNPIRVSNCQYKQVITLNIISARFPLVCQQNYTSGKSR